MLVCTRTRLKFSLLLLRLGLTHISVEAMKSVLFFMMMDALGSLEIRDVLCVGERRDVEASLDGCRRAKLVWVLLVWVLLEEGREGANERGGFLYTLPHTSLTQSGTVFE